MEEFPPYSVLERKIHHRDEGDPESLSDITFQPGNGVTSTSP